MRREIQVHIILCESIAVSTYYARQDMLVYLSTNSVMSLLNCSRSTASRAMDAVVRAYNCFFIGYDGRGRKLLQWSPDELWYCVGWDMENILASRLRIDREFGCHPFRETDYIAANDWHQQYLDRQDGFSEGKQE